MIPWLNDNTGFPPVEQALQEPNGLLAASQSLSTQQVIRAYKLGIFPWYSEPDPVLWWSPSPRCVLVPKNIHISRSMRRLIKQPPFELSYDQNFEAVIDACAAREEGTWISDEVKSTYTALHHQGLAHSVEVWQGEALAGGLYGIAMGSIFFAESMFSHVSNASKFALIKLAQQLDAADYRLIDCQVGSAHLYSLGASDMSRADFKQALEACYLAPKESPWDLSNSHQTLATMQGANGRDLA